MITFGCSWVYGVGAGYTNNMPTEDYAKMAWNESICNELSFRGLLSKKLEFTNLNFASGGSSNQRQFRLAKKFFFSDKFAKLQEEYQEIVVLWGITSTARNELYSPKLKDYKNFFYHTTESEQDWPFPKDFLLFSYDHQQSVYELKYDINLFNSFFKLHNVKCLWFDVFNHHNYENTADFFTDANKHAYADLKGDSWPSFEEYVNKTYKNIPDSVIQNIEQTFLVEVMASKDTTLENFLFFNKTPRDLLSLMLLNNNLHFDDSDSRYHFSLWDEDNNRIPVGIKNNLLNPHSHHPTTLGHQEIASILEPEIAKLIKE